MIPSRPTVRSSRPANAATLHVLRYCPFVAIIVDLELDAPLVRVRLERRLQASAVSTGACQALEPSIDAEQILDYPVPHAAVAQSGGHRSRTTRGAGGVLHRRGLCRILVPVDWPLCAMGAAAETPGAAHFTVISPIDPRG